MKDGFVAMFCPPVKDFIEQPKDISTATKENCPECGQLMWMSEKKNFYMQRRNTIKNKYYVIVMTVF
jgi:hypothetical protein